MNSDTPVLSADAARKYKALTLRILNNMISAANGDEIVYRTRAKYSLTDVPVVLFDSILQSLGIEAKFTTRTRARYYTVEELKVALQRLKGEQ